MWGASQCTRESRITYKLDMTLQNIDNLWMKVCSYYGFMLHHYYTFTFEINTKSLSLPLLLWLFIRYNCLQLFKRFTFFLWVWCEIRSSAQLLKNHLNFLPLFPVFNVGVYISIKTNWYFSPLYDTHFLIKFLVISFLKCNVNFH